MTAYICLTATLYAISAVSKLFDKSKSNHSPTGILVGLGLAGWGAHLVVGTLT